MKKLLALFASLALVVSLANLAFSEAADVEEPSDVENVTAEAGDSMVTLSWDVALDNVGVTGYMVYSGLSSVSEAGDEYTFPAQDVGDVVSAEVLGLENGTTYYFAVIAYDAAGNESLNYSFEVSATPEEGLGGDSDNEAPTVVGAEAISKAEVKVEMSEEVELTEDNPEQAFTIENEETLEPLEVLDAVVMKEEDLDEDEMDKLGMLVMLTTAEQEKDATYILTATIDVTDLAGNPIISGTSDTAQFTGSDAEPVDATIEAPEVVDVEYMAVDQLLVNFSKTVVLGLDTADNFEVKVKNSTKTLEVTEVVLGNNATVGAQDASAVLTLGEEMVTGTTYVVTVSDVVDEDGNVISADADSAEIVAGGVDEPPVDEPDPVVPVLKDAEDFVANVVNQDDVLKVALSWMLPSDSSAVAQKIYRSEDGSVYSDEADLDMSDTSHSVTDGLVADEDYWFKLTQIDDEGNESEGVLTKVNLSETGPGVAGLILVSLGLGRLFGKRKK